MVGWGRKGMKKDPRTAQPAPPVKRTAPPPPSDKRTDLPTLPGNNAQEVAPTLYGHVAQKLTRETLKEHYDESKLDEYEHNVLTNRTIDYILNKCKTGIKGEIESLKSKVEREYNNTSDRTVISQALYYINQTIIPKFLDEANQDPNTQTQGSLEQQYVKLLNKVSNEIKDAIDALEQRINASSVHETQGRHKETKGPDPDDEQEGIDAQQQLKGAIIQLYLELNSHDTSTEKQHDTTNRIKNRFKDNPELKKALLDIKLKSIDGFIDQSIANGRNDGVIEEVEPNQKIIRAIKEAAAQALDNTDRSLDSHIPPPPGQRPPPPPTHTQTDPPEPDQNTSCCGAIGAGLTAAMQYATDTYDQLPNTGIETRLKDAYNSLADLYNVNILPTVNYCLEEHYGRFTDIDKYNNLTNNTQNTGHNGRQ